MKCIKSQTDLVTTSPLVSQVGRAIGFMISKSAPKPWLDSCNCLKALFVNTLRNV